MYTPHALDARLASVLPDGSLFAVGGRVRDELRSEIDRTEVPIKDLDYVVTGVPLDDLRARLERVGRVDQRLAARRGDERAAANRRRECYEYA